MQKPKFQIYLDSPQENMITCRPMVHYGDREFSIYTTEDIALRDMSAEQILRNLVHEYTNAFDPSSLSAVIVDDEELEYDMLVNGIPAMQAIGEVFVSNTLKKMEVQSAPKVTVGVSLEGNLLELSMTAGDMSQAELIEILSRYNSKKKFYRLKDDPVVASVKNKSFRSLVRNMKTIEDNDFEVPQNLQDTLREYQKRGFLWLKTLCHNGFGGILADDMGLGKTLQVIAFLLSERLDVELSNKVDENARNALIVAPASLVYNWHNEITRFAPELTPRMVTGNAAERSQIIKEAGCDDILLTSYDLLKRDIDEYEKYNFKYQVIDEAQYIKNASTQAAKAVIRYYFSHSLQPCWIICRLDLKRKR